MTYFSAARAEPASLGVTRRRGTRCSGDSCKISLKSQRKRRRRAKRAPAAARKQLGTETPVSPGIDTCRPRRTKETGRLRRGDFPGNSLERGAVLAPPIPAASSFKDFRNWGGGVGATPK